MTEKELKKLNRYQLLELLVMQTERADKLQERIDLLEQKLAKRDLSFSELGSIAEAAVEVSGIINSAQQAADLYLNSAKLYADELIVSARRQADAIVAEAKGKSQGLSDAPRRNSNLLMEKWLLNDEE